MKYSAVVLLVLSVCLILVASEGERKRYDNYQVIRLSIANHTDYERAFKIADNLLLDVWASNAIEQWMDVMIPPVHTNAVAEIFPEFPFVVRIPNVQEDIDVSEAESEQQKRQSDFFSTFRVRSAINTWLDDQVSAHPNEASRISIGNSYLGNPINALHLLKQSSRKPVIVIQCGIHAREWIAPTTCCWIIDQILNHEDSSSPVHSFEWVIVPVLNVDGYDYTHSTDRLWRKNRQPNSGSTCVGTDPNRNYGYMWSGPGASSNPCSETFYGKSAWSAPVTASIQNLMENILSDSLIIAFFDIHSYGAYWVGPWGYTCATRPPDYNAQQAIATLATNACYDVNGRRYAAGPSCNVIYQTSGSSPDYAYGGRRVVYAYTVEAYGSNFTPPASWIGPVGREITAGVFATAKGLLSKMDVTNAVKQQ